MGRKRKNKGKSSPKGRGHVARKTSRGLGQGGKMQVVAGPQYVADTARVRLKYTDQTIYTIASSAGAMNSVSYTMNDPTQCNHTTAAGVPQGWATYSGQFQRFCVIHSHIRWRIRNLKPGDSFGSLGTLGVNPTHSVLYGGVLAPLPSTGALATTLAGAAVQKYASRRHDFPIAGNLDGTSGFPDPSRTNPAEIWTGSRSMSISKLEGEPNLRSSLYEASVSTGPPAVTQVCYWVFYLLDMLADATGKGVLLFEVDVTYDCLFFDRKTVSDTFLAEHRLSAKSTDAVSCRAEEKKAPPPSSSPFALDTDSDFVLVKRDSLPPVLSVTPAARGSSLRSVSLKG